MTVAEIVRAAAEQTEGGRVHSSVAAAHIQWVRNYHGDAAVRELFRMLDADVARELGSEGGWMSFASLVALDQTIERKFGRGRGGFLRELGRYSAHLNLRAARVHLRGAAVHDFFHSSALLHARFQDFGTVLYEELGLTHGRMSHVDASCFSPVWCASTIGYYEQALVMQDAVPVRVEEVACRCNGDATCVFELQWA